MEVILQGIESIIGKLSDFVWLYFVIASLVIVGLYFSFKTKFVQFRYFREMLRIIGEPSTVTEEGKKGISSFQAFCISAASRVGTGNIAGVATAVAAGGPGAIFWMWLIASLGGATSLIESTLAQIYKVKDKDGFRGGPAYYMEKGLKKRWMGIVFAIIITFCFGFIFNSVQSNTISIAFKEAFGIDRSLMGIVLAILTAVIIFGGLKRIVTVSQIVVPIMAIIYLAVALIVVFMNITEIPRIFTMIVKGAFGLDQVIGGTFGAAVMMGIKRGLFSNEAGMGSAPNAAATAAVSHPVKQGLIQTLGVFFDTIIICSATAFIILLYSDFSTSGLTGIELTQAALSAHVGFWAPTFVAVAIFLFAFTSVIGNYYYGETNLEFIKNSPIALFIYRIIVVGMVFFGALVKVEIVWTLADLFMGIMALINLVAIAMLGKIAFAALKDYKKQRAEGKDPVFYADTIPGLDGIECWETKEKALKDKTQL